MMSVSVAKTRLLSRVWQVARSQSDTCIATYKVMLKFAPLCSFNACLCMPFTICSFDFAHVSTNGTVTYHQPLSTHWFSKPVHVWSACDQSCSGNPLCRNILHHSEDAAEQLLSL